MATTVEETPQRTDTKDSTPVEDYAAGAKAAVKRYYQQLNNREFDSSWEMLSSELQGQLGPYEDWLAGYELTEGTHPSVHVQSADEESARASVHLNTDDLDVCGEHVPQEFDGSWDLARVSGEWRPVRIYFEKVSGGDPVRDPAGCAEYLPVEVPEDYAPPTGFERSDGQTLPGVPLYTAPQNFCDTHDCIPNFPNGTGYPVRCQDGSWSQSGGRPGACSWHGGVG